MSKPTPIKSLITSLEILETLVELNGATVTDLATQLDIPKSTTHDHLRTLLEMQYVHKVDSAYYVTSRLLKLGVEVRNNHPIFSFVRSELPVVADEVGEHASLMIEEGGYGVYVYIAEGKDTVDTVAPPGTRTQLHMTAPGKAILAHMPSERREHIIDEHGLSAATNQTITNYDDLLDELETIKQNEYAVDQGELIEGYHGVAVPVLDRTNQVPLGAISVYNPGRRSTVGDFKDGSVDVLIRVANIIEINYAHAP